MRRFVPIGILAVLAVAGCSDSTQVVTFVDGHGRVCTAAVLVDSDGDREATTMDCEYPPEGRVPGPTEFQEFPRQPEG